MTPDFTIKAGDRLPRIDGVCQTYISNAWAAVDISGATLVINIRSENSSTVALTAGATINSGSAGTWYYEWGANDTGTTLGPGRFFVELEVTFPSTKKMTFPNDRRGFSLLITDDIG